jgi:hypothetical protein
VETRKYKSSTLAADLNILEQFFTIEEQLIHYNKYNTLYALEISCRINVSRRFKYIGTSNHTWGTANHIMSCNCSCSCEGSWQTPAISLPIDHITFVSDNSMHCAQSPTPRHRLACNLPDLSRGRRSTSLDCDTDDSATIVLWGTALFFIMLCLILTLINYRLWKKLALKESQKDVEQIKYNNWFDVK